MILLIYITIFILINYCKCFPQSTLNKIHEPEAQCKFTVHEKNSKGREVSGTSLNQELYYRIKCQTESGYCLKVSNCTVSTTEAGQEPYEIIDEFGCTKEPTLFEHVEYEDNYTAGIYNPFPIRFRGNQKASIRFQCATNFIPVMSNDVCPRESCITNEYTRESNS